MGISVCNTSAILLSADLRRFIPMFDSLHFILSAHGSDIAKTKLRKRFLDAYCHPLNAKLVRHKTFFLSSSARSPRVPGSSI